MNFSVVIPLYNKAPYIRKAIESVLLQTLKAKEVIVIDDESTDGGGDQLEELGQCIKVVRQKNRGVGIARNRGIALAKEEWVALLDADDFWRPEHLQELARIISLHPEASLVATQFEQIDISSLAKIHQLAPGLIRQIDFFAESSRRMGCVFSSSAAVRKTILSHISGFGTTQTGEDTEFWARVALRFPIAISEAPTAFYVRGVGGIVETLAANRANNKTDQISAESALQNHPACKTVLAALSEKSFIVPKKSLLLYLNAWRIVFMRQALVRGDTHYANEMRAQLSGPMRTTWYSILALSYLPPLFIRLTLATWRKIKPILAEIR